MSGKLKYYIIWITLFLYVVPFVLVTDFYPFMRFGMFSEKLTPSKEVELFEVKIFERGEKQKTEQVILISPHILNYLGRNYYYRNESDLMLQKLAQGVKVKKGTTIKLYRVVVSGDSQLPSEISSYLVP